ncbi:MAG: hypothetical protein HQK58_17820 [Deltaproteobacteria bacterium]|nr:hypothetical protein [Deltaproteobacteria bacterium]
MTPDRIKNLELRKMVESLTKVENRWELFTINGAEILVVSGQQAGIADDGITDWGDWTPGDNRVTDYGHYLGTIKLDNGDMVEIFSHRVVWLPGQGQIG